MPTMIAPLIVSGFAAAGASVSLATATTIATIGLYATTAIAQYAIQAAMAPEKKIGTKVSIAFGGDVEQSIIIGEAETAGSLVYAGSWGMPDQTPNAYFVRVVCLSDMPIDGVKSRIWFNGEKHTIDWEDHHSVNGNLIGSPVITLREDGRDMAWVKYQDGSQTVADPYLRDKFADAQFPFKSTMIGRGRAMLILTVRYDKKEPEGLPSMKAVCQGVHFYNPKKDSTNGGSGDHRWGNRSTYEYEDDPAVAAYNVERGIYYNGKWMMGGRNLPAYLLDNDSYVASINACNDNIDLKHGGTEKRYRLGAEFSLASTGYEVLDVIRSTCAGRASEAGGVMYFDVGAIGAASYSITDDDIVVTQSQDSIISPSLSQRVNTIVGTYTEPENGGDAKALRPKTVAAYVEEDDEQELAVSVTLRAVRSNTQGQRLINYQLNDNRRSRSHNIVLGPAFRGLRSGKVINWTSARYQYANKKWICGDVKIMASGLVATSIREADPSDGDWSTLKEDDYVVGVYGRIVPAAQKLHLSATSFPIRNNAGKNKRAGIKATWTKNDDDVDRKRVSVRVRLKDTQEIVARETADDDALEIIFEKGIVRNEDYQVSGLIIPESDRATEWSDWEDVTAPDVKMDDEDVELPLMRAEIQVEIDAVSAGVGGVAGDLAAEIAARVAAIQAQADALAAEAQSSADAAFEASDRYRDLMSELRGIAAEASNQGLTAYAQKEELRQTLTTRRNADYAEFDQRIVVAVSDNAALALRTTTLEVGTTALTASVNTVDLARISGDQALAAQITSLSAGTNSQFDQVDIWRFDAGVEGWTGNGAPTQTGTYLRPADHATDPYVVSPAALAVDGVSYTQVRARIKKIGVPVWEGYLYWKAGADATWDAGRRDTIVAPTFDVEGYGLITFNSAWAGTINQIRLDLSTAQTSTDYYLIDWVAIGRPSPGASSAELAEIKQAQIDGDAALALDISTLDVRMNDAETGIDLVSSAVTAVETSVEDLGDSLVAQGTILDGLSTEIEGKASIESVDELTNIIADFGTPEGVVSLGESVRSIRNQLEPIATLTADAAIAAFLQRQNIRAALATATQTLSTQITLTKEQLDVVSTAVTLIQAQVPGLATADALQALVARVLVNENGVSSNATAVTRLKADLGWVDGNAEGARATALTSLAASISSVLTIANGKNRFYRQTTAPTDVPAGTLVIGDLWADSDDSNRLYRWTAGTPNSWVETTDARIGPLKLLVDSHSQSMIDIENYVGDYSAGASQTLDSRVVAAYDLANSKNRVYRQTTEPADSPAGTLRGGDLWFDTDDGNKAYRWNGSAWVEITDARVTATATALTELFAGDGSDVSSVRVRMRAVAGAESGWARYAIQLKAAGTFSSVGFAMDIKNDGSDGKIVFDADKYVFRNGGSLTGPPFKIVGGGVRLDNVDIGDADISRLTVKRANIEDLAINGAKVDLDAITTTKVAARQIEKHDAFSVAQSGTYSFTGISGSPPPEVVNLGNLSPVVNTNPSAVVLGITYSMSVSIGVTQPSIIDVSGEATTRIKVYSEKIDGSNSQVVFNEVITVSANTNGSTSVGSDSKAVNNARVFVVDVYASPDNRRYRVEATYTISTTGTASSTHDASADINVIWWQR